jgi:acyl-CoA synthetase (AMP-forming)/AMP-acid ligase II
VLDNKTPQFVMDWREHPWKDQRWYDALPTGVFGSAMTAQQIAQEVDRDLDASQPGKVWKFSEPHILMTWRDVVELYEKFHRGDKFRDASGRYIIPRDWRWSRYHDYGQTPGHEWAYLIAARPSET